MKLLGLKPYFDCKDSGMQWLGEVPKHWGFDSVEDSYKPSTLISIEKYIYYYYY